MIKVYLILTFALSSIFYALIISAGTMKVAGGVYVLGLMWCAGVAAMLTCLIKKRPIATLGWRWPMRYLGYGYLIPIAYALPVYIVTWLTGLGSFPNVPALGPMATALGGQLSPGAIVAIYIAVGVTIGMLPATLAALGEEIGWRGFFVPELMTRFTFTQTALVSGAIWAAWHAPILLFADYNSGTPWWYGLSCFALMVISISFVFAWIRLKSGSLWPAAIMHASHNVWIQAVFDKLTIKRDVTPWIIGEFGIGLVIATAIVAIIVARASGSQATSEQIPPQPEMVQSPSSPPARHSPPG